MELEQMKMIWETENKNRVDYQQLDEQTIGSIMKKQSQTTLANIKRNMKLKARAAAAFSVFAVTLATLFLFGFLDEPLSIAQFLTPNETGGILMLMGVVLSVIAVANHRGYKRIDQFEQSSGPLKQTLNKIVDILQKIMTLGIYSDVVFVPLIVGFASYVWLYQRNGFALDIRLLYLVLIIAGVTILSHRAASRLMHRKYGDDLQRMKGYIKELGTLNK